jgi:hypothetical protein
MTTPRAAKFRHIESIAALGSIAALIVAANIRDPSLQKRILSHGYSIAFLRWCVAWHFLSCCRCPGSAIASAYLRAGFYSQLLGARHLICWGVPNIIKRFAGDRDDMRLVNFKGRRNESDSRSVSWNCATAPPSSNP